MNNIKNIIRLGIIVMIGGLIFVLLVIPIRNKSIALEFKDCVLMSSTEEMKSFLCSHRHDYNQLIHVYLSDWNPFEHIAEKDEFEKIDLLLKHGVSTEFSNIFDSKTNSYYPNSNIIRKPKILQSFLQYGLDANPTRKNNYKRNTISPLYVAIGALFPGIFKYGKHEKLKDAGYCSSMPLQDWQAYYDKRNAEEPAILSSINLLLSSGADVDKGVLGDTRKLTPLMMACWKGRIDMIELLLHKGADPYIDDNHFFALDFCYMTNGFVSEEERQKAINLLVERMQK